MADLNIRPGCVVADVGCGSGYFALRLARAVGASGRVYAADPSGTALEELRGAADRLNSSNIEIVRSEPADTRLPSACADVALLCDVIHEARPADRAALVRDIARVLKAGGFLYLIDYRKSREVKFDPYEKLVAREDLLRLCADAGLECDAEFFYLKYQVFLRFRKPPLPPDRP